MQTHFLKILPHNYEAVESGIKTCETRYNDRDYQVGDILVLQEWSPGAYKGQEIRRKITYISTYEQKPGYCVLSIAPYTQWAVKPESTDGRFNG